MITMSHDAVLFQGPLPSTAEAGRACLYKEKQTTRSAGRKWIPKETKLRQSGPSQAQTHLYQDARMHHSFCNAFKTPP